MSDATTPPCSCGDVNAFWQGDPHGLRVFACAQCGPEILEAMDEPPAFMPRTGAVITRAEIGDEPEPPEVWDGPGTYAGAAEWGGFGRD